MDYKGIDKNVTKNVGKYTDIHTYNAHFKK
jgi:hypothetical protein